LSHKSAWKAEKLGYTNIKNFAGGYPAWLKVKGQYGSVSPAFMKSQINKNADMVVVDSRPKRKKYDKGHIPTALSIPDSQFKKFTNQLPADKSKLLVFYCGGFKCPLSHKSAAKAIAMGYTNVKVFAAGYPAWKKVAGTAMAKSTGMSSVKAGTEEGSIDIAFFKRALKSNPDSMMVIDVRDKAEFDTGTFPTAINIPTDQLEAKIPSLPTNKAIVFVCSTGARSGEAYYMVMDLRPSLKNVFYLEAEISYTQDNQYTITAAVQ
jgi:rhodanese-related sulfurtransferase